MKHILRCFQEHKGTRGVTFYNGDSCNFLRWDEVYSFLQDLPKGSKSPFPEKLLDELANYDPESQFLAVKQNRGTVSVELYTAAVPSSALSQ